MTSRQISVTERIKLLEEKMNGLDKSLDMTLDQVRATLTDSLTAIYAVVGVLEDLNLVDDFPQKVETKIMQQRQERVNQQLSQEKAQRDALVAAKVIAPVEAVTEKSVLFVTVYDSNGQVVGLPARRVDFASFFKEIQGQLLGKPVGFSLETDKKERIEILEIYEELEQAPVQAQAEAPVESVEVKEA
jgi:hypothetical protein